MEETTAWNNNVEFVWPLTIGSWSTWNNLALLKFGNSWSVLIVEFVLFAIKQPAIKLKMASFSKLKTRLDWIADEVLAYFMIV